MQRLLSIIIIFSAPVLFTAHICLGMSKDEMSLTLANAQLTHMAKQTLAKTPVLYDINNQRKAKLANTILNPRVIVTDSVDLAGCSHFLYENFNTQHSTVNPITIYINTDYFVNESINEIKHSINHELGHGLFRLINDGHAIDNLALRHQPMSDSRRFALNCAYSTTSIAAMIALSLYTKTSSTFFDVTKLLASNIAINATFSTIAPVITHAISSTELSNKAQHAKEIFCDTYAAVIEPETIKDAIDDYKKTNTYSRSLWYYQTPKSCLSHPHDSTRIENFKKIQHYLTNNSQPKDVLNWSLRWTLDQYPELRGQLLGNQSRAYPKIK